MKLETFGWNSFFANRFAPYATQGLCAGRVALQHNYLYRLYTEHGPRWAEVSGKQRYQAHGRSDLPAVGDWVVIRLSDDGEKATIREILPRRSQFSRKMAGRTTEEQVVAANVDTLFLVMGLDQDFNLRRIERYLLLVSESGARPVVVLNKADLCEAALERARAVEAVAPDVPVLAVSAATGQGLEALQPFLSAGQTVALLGSSGVGKSTLINQWVGVARQKVQDVRVGDGRGKHTTTYRELILLSSGALVVDTPGLRELQLWVTEEGLQETFTDIEQLAARCRFRDCRHRNEPGCAVSQALDEGDLDLSRFRNYQKLQKELRHLTLKQDARAGRLERERWKKLSHQAKKIAKHKRRGPY